MVSFAIHVESRKIDTFDVTCNLPHSFCAYSCIANLFLFNGLSSERTLSRANRFESIRRNRHIRIANDCLQNSQNDFSLASRHSSNQTYQVRSVYRVSRIACTVL